MNGRSNVQWVDKAAASELTNSFNMNSPCFLALAKKQDFLKLKHNLIPIYIHSAIRHLTADSYLEITFPVSGITDFLAIHLKNSVWNQQVQPFLSVLAINGWGAGDFPRPDFIVVKDILGNQYEILVNAQGEVEIPEEGTGLFSILSEITLMYSFNQVVKGRGLESLTEEGAQPNQLYLLPPPNTTMPFSMTLRSVRLENECHRVVDFEQVYVFGVNPDKQHAKLSEFGARSLIRYLLPEVDFVRSVLKEGGLSELGIAQLNDFNDFVLNYDAIGKYYNLLIGAVIHQQIPMEFLLSRVKESSFTMAAFRGFPLDAIDYRTIETLGAEALKELTDLSPRNAYSSNSKSFMVPFNKVTQMTERLETRGSRDK